MLRLLLLPFLLILFSSCNDASKEDDPLFYQISEADSTRCMGEILSGILEDTLQIHQIMGCIPDPNRTYNGPLHVSQFNINSRAGIKIDHKIGSDMIAELTYEFFMHNRNLTWNETERYFMDKNYYGFNFPFYNQYSPNEILKRIKDAQRQFDELKKVNGIDASFIEQEASKVAEWKVLKRAMELLNTPTVPRISLEAHVRFGLLESVKKSKYALKQIAFAFYQMRNYECLKYFNETYLSLYERAQRKKRKIDLDKLDVLELIHPSAIVADYYQAKRLLQIASPPILPLE